ncbi:hypothetical protein [Paenibacillus albidus]|uniref:hypothetical protein n=1 Tax=Paenibacillus albidus TaxID=2041023 RepID=UPI0020365D75|nr:hypothetical protein [Paenibacillus albidus]
MQNDPHPARLLAQLVEDQPQVRIASGRLESNIGESFRQAQSAMNVLLALQPPSQTISYEEVEFLVVLILSFHKKK